MMVNQFLNKRTIVILPFRPAWTNSIFYLPTLLFNIKISYKQEFLIVGSFSQLWWSCHLLSCDEEDGCEATVNLCQGFDSEAGK